MTTDSTSGESLEKINVKFSLVAPADQSYDFLLSIFGRWRLDKGEEIIDLADYLHVPDGPGCLLVSQRWHFGIDFAGGRPGLYFSNRGNVGGDAAERFRTVIASCLEKGKMLFSEEGFPQDIRPSLGELEVVINDRILAENSDASDGALRPGLVATLDRLYGEGSYRIDRESDPRRRLGYHIEARSTRPSFEPLLSRLHTRP